MRRGNGRVGFRIAGGTMIAVARRGALGIVRPFARSTRARGCRVADEVERIATPDAPETVEVDTDRVWCDGSGGALGHPRVFLTLVNGVARVRLLRPPLRAETGAKPRHHH